MKKRLFAFFCATAIAITTFLGAGVWAKPIEPKEIPERYDLRELGKVTSVKDQGEYATDWAFAAAAVIESNALVRGYGEYDISEYQLGYLITHILSYWNTTMGSEGPLCDTDWYNGIYGANISSALLRGYSLGSEEDYPYKDITKVLPKEGISMDGDLYVESCYTVPASDIEAMKELIFKNGALYTNVCSASWDSEAIYNKETNAAYLPKYTDEYNSIDHFVTIVGWDDNYSKDNFVTKPAADGAWIIKDSRGTKKHNNGYLYISYYDAAFNSKNSATSITVRKERNYDRIYQYDGGVGLLNVDGVTEVVINFTAEDNEAISGVRIKPIGDLLYNDFYCSDWSFDNINVEVSVYKGKFDAKKIDKEINEIQIKR